MPLANIPKMHNVFTRITCTAFRSVRVYKYSQELLWAENISCKVQILTFRLLQKGRVMQRLRQWCKPSSSIIGNLPLFAQIWVISGAENKQPICHKDSASANHLSRPRRRPQDYRNITSISTSVHGHIVQEIKERSAVRREHILYIRIWQHSDDLKCMERLPIKYLQIKNWVWWHGRYGVLFSGSGKL